MKALAAGEVVNFISHEPSLEEVFLTYYREGSEVAPAEIDEILLRHPGILEAAAVGVPDPIYGEEVACYVVVKPGTTLNEASVRKHCEAFLPPPKMPKPPASLTAFTSRLPEIVSIGANRIGCRIPSRAVNSVLIAMRLLPVLDKKSRPAYCSLKMNTRECSHL